MSSFRQEIELECRPVLKDVICRFGEKCFHNIHYVCIPEDIPEEDVCPFDANVSNLRINTVERAGNCVRISGLYDICVFFRYDEGRRIGTACREDVAFTVQVPVQPVNGGCYDIYCESGLLEREVCAYNTRLEVVEATVEPDGEGDEDFCEERDFRIRVVVEKIFRAFEHGCQVICIPACPQDVCVPPPTTEAPFCPPFVRPTECPSFCESDEIFYPDNCDQCPPPQVTVAPTTVAPAKKPCGC